MTPVNLIFEFDVNSLRNDSIATLNKPLQDSFHFTKVFICWDCLASLINYEQSITTYSNNHRRNPTFGIYGKGATFGVTCRRTLNADFSAPTDLRFVSATRAGEAVLRLKPVALRKHQSLAKAAEILKTMNPNTPKHQNPKPLRL